MNKYYAPDTDAQIDAQLFALPKGADLSKLHQQMLMVESGISVEAINARGYFTLPADASSKEWLKAQGFSSKQYVLGECLVIPTHNWRGEVSGYTLRPTIPRNDKAGKSVKYETRAGSSPTLDVAVLTLDQLGDTTTPLVWTEGAKKADAAASHGLCAISLNGVYGFRGKNLVGGVANLGELDEINLQRTHLLIFDSDWQEKDGVFRAMQRLADAIARRKGIVKMVTLPHGQNGKRTGLDDYFAGGGTVEGLYKLASDLIGLAERNKQKSEAKKAERAKQVAEEAKERDVPVIETNGRQLIAKLRDLSRAVEDLNGKHPMLFRGLEGMVHISHDATGAASIKRVSRAHMQAVATEAAMWISTTEREGVSSVSPPRELCENYLDTEKWWCGIPSLERVAQAPFFAADGTLCDQTNYYPSAKAWLSLPLGFSIGDTTPNQQNIAKAKALILDTILGEVAFANDASCAHAVGQMILPFVRLMIDGPSPLHLWNAPGPGSGKTYSANLCNAPFGMVSPQGEKTSPEEWRKSLFSALASGPSHIFLDNIKGSLNSPFLDAAITSPDGYISERIIGTSDVVKAPVWCVWVATANNAQLTQDAAQRSIVVELDPNCENPGAREFSHNPAAFVRDNRDRVCGAVITLVRAWLESGKPIYRGPHRSRFPKWQEVIGGILEVVGVPGFLENIEETQEAISEDQSDEWHEFTELAFERFGDSRKTARELLQIAELVPDLKDNLDGKADVLGKEKCLSSLLTRHANQRFGNLKIMSAGKFQRRLCFKVVDATQIETRGAKKSESAQVTQVAEVPLYTRKSQQNFISSKQDEMKNSHNLRPMADGSASSVTCALLLPGNPPTPAFDGGLDI